MFTISVCMIVRDEEDCLENALKSVKDFADEIVVVDTGSVDKTKEIARKYTDKVFDFEWIDDFSKARNYSFSLATCDYIMWLDADDIILEKDILEIKKLKERESQDVDAFMFKYVYRYEKDYTPTYSYMRERLVKRSRGFKWKSPIHETIEIYGKIERVSISIYHHKLKENPPERNLKIFQKMIENKVQLDTRQYFYYARELYYNNHIENAIEMFLQVLDRSDLWIENRIEAMLNLAKCYELTGDNESALKTLFSSFCFDAPRAEILCEIGKILRSQNRIKEAIFWYELALTIKPNMNSGGFVELDCYDFIPYVELCCCYYNEDREISKTYHEKAKKLKPNADCILQNEKFFCKK